MKKPNFHRIKKPLAVFLLISLAIAGILYFWFLPWWKQPSSYRNPDQWVLIFEDEFQGSSLNTSKWDYNYPTSWPHGGHTHNHYAYMTEENVFVENGVLRIKGENHRHENAPASEWAFDRWLEYNYTAGAVNTFQTFKFTEGYIEGKFKMPASQGFWPAFWTLNSVGGWPPEIDILETLMHDPTTLYCTYHWGEDWTQHQSWGHHHLDLPNLSEDFHTYGVEWSKSAIKWYFDGQQIGKSFTNQTAIAQCEEMYIIINLAIGGWEPLPNEETIWPGWYECDWIRVWEMV